MKKIHHPYPEQYEMNITTRGGIRIFVRPIKPEDAPLLVELFNSLSHRSIYYRFFGPMKNLPPAMLAKLTQIDREYDMALVALRMNGNRQTAKILGVSRLFRGQRPGKTAEFAIAVGDAWQGKGIGAVLMEKLMSIARERGVNRLWGMVLAENTQMLTLGQKLGFSVSRDFRSNQYRLEIDPQAMPTDP